MWAGGGQSLRSTDKTHTFLEVNIEGGTICGLLSVSSLWDIYIPYTFFNVCFECRTVRGFPSVLLARNVYRGFGLLKPSLEGTLCPTLLR